MKSGSDYRRNMYRQQQEPSRRESSSSRHYYEDDHLEDFDSRQPDFASIQGEATMAQSIDNNYHHQGPSRQGERNSVPGMSFLDGMEQSVMTKDMEEMMDYTHDDGTFDGSTITSNIESKRYRHDQNQNAAVIDWGDMPASERKDSPPSPQPKKFVDSHNNYNVRPAASSDPTVNTFSSGRSGSRESSAGSRAKACCCGLGRATLCLVCAVILVVSVAVILYLVLVTFDSSSDSSGGLASPCCKGSFEINMLGKEVCSGQTNGNDVCCVVCEKNIGQEEPEEEPEPQPDDDEEEAPEEDEPATPAPTASPTYIRTAPPTSTATTSPSAAPSLRATTSVPSMAPTSPAPDTAVPTVAATTQAPTMAATEVVTSALDATYDCCTEFVSGDFVGRNRCIDPTEPRNTCALCQVCPTGTEDEVEEPATGFVLD